MSENKSIYKSNLVVSIVLIILLFVCILIIYTQNNTSQYYDNIGMNKDLLNIIYFNVGQADSTFITSNGVNMLIDAGNDSDGYYIANFLKEQNINSIDYLILTHIDEDHAGGAYKIIEELDIGIIYMPNAVEDKKFYHTLISTAESNNVNIDKTLVASDTTQYELRKCSLESFTH